MRIVALHLQKRRRANYADKLEPTSGDQFLPTSFARNVVALIAAGSLVFIVGCGSPKPSGKPIKTSDAERNTESSAANEQIREQREKVRAAIDRDFPAAKPPATVREAFAVRNVSDSGIIELDGHPPVRLEGVVCRPEGTANIRTMLLDPDVKLLPDAEPNSNSTPARTILWMVQNMEIENRVDLSFIQIAEAALTSGWCSSVRVGQEGYNPRYEALEEYAKKFPN